MVGSLLLWKKQPFIGSMGPKQQYSISLKLFSSTMKIEIYIEKYGNNKGRMSSGEVKYTEGA